MATLQGAREDGLFFAGLKTTCHVSLLLFFVTYGDLSLFEQGTMSCRKKDENAYLTSVCEAGMRVGASRHQKSVRCP